MHYRIGNKQGETRVSMIPVFNIEVKYVPTEDHFLIGYAEKGKLVWKPF
jgi:hypothetical protein